MVDKETQQIQTTLFKPYQMH